jgi:hypothetical protein
VDPVDRRDRQDYHDGFNPEASAPLHGDNIDWVLAALMKGLPAVQGINADALVTLSKDLPMPDPGMKDGFSVEEAVEVNAI